MRTLALLLGASTAALAHAQSFQAHYGDYRHQDAVAVFSDAQGVIAVVRDAPMGLEAANSARVRLLRTSSAGVEQAWHDVALFSGSVFVQGAIQEGTTALVLCGSVIRAGRDDHDAFIAKVDLQGAVLWAWSTDTPDLEEQVLDVKRTVDGKYIGGGMRRAGGDSDAYLALVNASGTGLWETHIGTAADEKISALIADANGFTGVGQVAVAGKGWNAYILRTDLNGAEQWSQDRGGNKDDLAFAVVGLSPTTFAWAGWTDSFGPVDHYNKRKRNIRVMALTTDGDSLWAVAIGDTLVNRSGFALALCSNGDLLIGGKRNPQTDGEALVVRTDATGALLWEHGYDLLGEDEVRSLFIQVGDGGFVAAGWGFGDHSGDVLLLRKNASGN